MYMVEINDEQPNAKFGFHFLGRKKNHKFPVNAEYSLVMDLQL